MDEIKATFKIVTPMFIGGANQQAAPELSAKAIKSAIMFWWRALNCSKYKTLNQLYERERELFGGSRIDKESTKKERKNVVSPILFSILNSQLKTGSMPQNCTYLAYGLDYKVKNKKQHRQCIEGSFTLRLVSKKPICNCVIDAIKVFGLLGGLGARALKGFGSTLLVSLEKNDTESNYAVPSTKKSYIELLEKLFGDEIFTCYVIPSMHHSRITLEDRRPHHTNAVSVLSDFNNASYQNRTNMSGKGYGNFKDDLSWLYQKAPKENILPERSAFGMPHNYFVNFSQQNITLNVDVKPSQFERRESPLRFHVQQLKGESGNEFIGVLFYFKSDFLPPELDEINMKWKRQRPKPSKPDFLNAKANMLSASSQYKIITNFMDGKSKEGEQVPSTVTKLNHQKIYEDGIWQTENIHEE